MFALVACSLALLEMGPVTNARTSWRPPELSVRRRAPATSADEVLATAAGYVGRPYVSGGIGNPGFDCSGFVCRVFAESGYALPRVSRDQARAGKAVALDALQPGDLVFFVDEPGDVRISHVALYAGGGEIVHASTGQGAVATSRLSAAYYQNRLVTARRVLPDASSMSTTTTTATGPSLTSQEEVIATEWVEHDGPSSLSPLFRLPSRIPRPSISPGTWTFPSTGVGLKAALVTENQRLGFVLAPRLEIHVESVPLVVALTAPVRFVPGESPSVGRIESFKDTLRFLERASLGLEGADLFFAFDHNADVTLGARTLVDHLHLPTVGVPGFSTGDVPITMLAHYRDARIEIETAVADVGEPSVLAASIEVPLVAGILSAGLGVAGDIRATTTQSEPTTLLGAEGSANLRAIDMRNVAMDVALAGSMLRNDSSNGFGLSAALDAEWRFSRGGAHVLSLRGEVGRLFAHYVDNVFGPTYIAERPAHLFALATDAARTIAGVESMLRIGKLVVSGGYRDAVGGDVLMDQEVFALLAAEKIPMGHTRSLDVRASYAARGLSNGSSPPLTEAVFLSARLHLSSFVVIEAYLTKSLAFEGGGGLTFAWMP